MKIGKKEESWGVGVLVSLSFFLDLAELGAMEVRSEPSIMASREPFTIQKSPVVQSQPSMQNMRLTFAPDGTAVYKPIAASSPPPTAAAAAPPSYQGASGGGGSNGGSGPAGGGNGLSSAIPAPHGLNINMGVEPIKRKRGRPRKYGPDGTMALAITPVSPSVGPPSGGNITFSSTPTAATGPHSADAMKKRGRPSGSGKKMQMAALGSAGTGFVPHVITVKAGEDVSSKIMSFSQNGPRAVCILSANGAISNVTLRQAATSGGTVTYEGRFEILSLSGSFLLSENGGQRSRTGGLSVSLAGPDGRVLGGGVAGLLTAASPVQVVVGSFIAEGKKEKEQKQHIPVDPSSAPTKIVNSGPGPMPMMGRANSPPSRGTLSESSGGPGSPMNQSTGGTCNNSNQQGMSNMLWK
ncbi:AT-hook motif nuclear-localized protein 10-like [Iris pallida]|uniref:AT-hook motif nuclear-localized protein n=1 Tax=Iris pallida TaxID=29817 RepID=A0AAX6EM22_IRIPA|nr:AT-hook motif nuclear-localized protein 10-like [Iris pallida]KAJ6828692.1 AT-hook motif nuclear-localized protein 10-like [Iris pallida]